MAQPPSRLVCRGPILRFSVSFRQSIHVQTRSSTVTLGATSSQYHLIWGRKFGEHDAPVENGDVDPPPKLSNIFMPASLPGQTTKVRLHKGTLKKESKHKGYSRTRTISAGNNGNPHNSREENFKLLFLYAQWAQGRGFYLLGVAMCSALGSLLDSHTGRCNPSHQKHAFLSDN